MRDTVCCGASVPSWQRGLPVPLSTLPPRSRGDSMRWRTSIGIIVLALSHLVSANASSALAQAGSTGGTIGKQDKSVSGDSPAVESAPAAKPRPRRSANDAPARANGESCGRISGTWQWWNGGETVFRMDGTASHTSGQTATWTCSDGNYVVSWSTGIDKLRISSDGKRLDGSNNLGQHASGIRK